MASAKEYAQQQLGNLDLGYLDKERGVAGDIYNTSTKGLDTNYNNLIEQINKNRGDTRKNFNTGRGTVAENAFTQNRLNNLDIGSRVAGKSGLKELGEVGNRMETGRQYSDLANTFYGDMDTLNMTERHGTDQYNLDKEGLKNTYNQSLAGIDSRGAEAGNNWNMTLAQLAEQVQGRWDSNANAQASLAQARAAASQANANAQAALKQQISAQDAATLKGILNSGQTGAQMQQAFLQYFKIDNAMADKILHENMAGGYSGINYGPNTSYTNQVLGR